MPCVFVTGASGRIGHAAVAELVATGNRVIGFDIHARDAPFVGERFVQGDLADLPLLKESMAGCDVVVHLGAVPDDAKFVEHLNPVNIVGTYNVVEAIRVTATVMRAMIASSGKIYSGYTGVTPITTDVAGRPRCWYSATKLLAESGAEVLAHADDIGRQVKVICARFGWVPRTPEDLDVMATIKGSGADGMNAYLSPDDAGRFVAACCTSALPAEHKYQVVFAQSLPQVGEHARFDVSDAVKLLEWEPKHRFPEGVEAIRGDVAYRSNPALFPREVWQLKE